MSAEVLYRAMGVAGYLVVAEKVAFGGGRKAAEKWQKRTGKAPVKAG